MVSYSHNVEIKKECVSLFVSLSRLPDIFNNSNLQQNASGACHKPLDTLYEVHLNNEKNPTKL